ncbi:MAG: MobF family relaxase, partial [Desulfovibrionaceae bacterium]|nr:MobF family relaxase [Desulfovibrionaceae bacterium]
MLTSCKLTGNPASISAYHTKEENYYFSQASGLDALGERDQARSHVRIHGKLAGRLGLKAGSEISQLAFTNILAGKDAAGNRVSGEHKVMGIDLVFSAPKSVSIAGLLTEKDSRVVEAHDQAVLETMREIEASCSGTRVWDGKELRTVQTGNLAYVTARDGYNRDHDPHLHTHVVVMNLTEEGGKVLALDGRQIMAQDFNKMWGAMCRAKLAARLKELGYSVSYTKKGELRLDAVSLEVEREFSKRRRQIENAKANGLRDMDAWRKTRKQKNPEIEKAEVRADWQSRMAKHREKTPEQVRQDTVKAREAWFKEARWSVEARQELAGERVQTEIARWQAAARRATEHTACASKEAMITEYLAELGRAETWQPMTFRQAEQLLHDQVRAGNILATDDGLYTTWEMARADRECFRTREARVPLALRAEEASSRVAEYSRAAQAQGRRGLSPLQAKAAAGILSAGRGAVVVQGDAGSGKTSMLRAVNDIGKAAGWEINGVAVQGMAARKLEEESGIKSVTLASYMAQKQTPARTRGSRLVVIDEASMLPSRGLAELLRRAEEQGDKVVLVGDRNQIQSIGAGKPFERLVEAAEKSGELLSLSENYRQRDPRLREAVDLARKGHMRESLDILDQAGKVDQEPDAFQRRSEMAKLYDKETLVLTGSVKGRDELNEMIRAELIRRGELAADASRRYRLCWHDQDGVRQIIERDLAVGERVVFLQNEYKDYDLRNGDLGTIVRTGKGTLEVRLEDGRELELDLARYSALDYGYALTTYKSQGQTYDKVLVEADTSVPQLQDQRNTYVQITRARDDVRIFTDDKDELRSLAGVLSVKQDTYDIDVSLGHAAHMESRVRERALAAQAELEVRAKIVQAQATAQKDAEVRVHNQAYLDQVAGSQIRTAGRLELMREVEDMLKERQDLSDGEKHRVAEYLSGKEGAAILRTYKAFPEYSIALGLAGSGTR